MKDKTLRLALVAAVITNGTGKLTTVTVSDSAPGDQRFYRLERTPTP
jgi:hypothetical protein